MADSLANSCGWLGLAIFLLTHWLSAAEHATGSSLLYWGCALGVVILPLSHSRITRFLRERLDFLAKPDLWAFTLQLIPLVLWPIVSPAHWLILVMTLFLGNLVGRPRSLVVTAWIVCLPPLQALAAMAAVPHSIWLVVLPLVAINSAAALIFLSLRYHFERLEERASRPYVRAWLSNSTRKSQNDEEIDLELRGRLRSALALGSVVLALLAIAYPLLVALPRPSFNPRRAAFGASDGTLANAARENRDSTNDNSGSNEYFPGDIHPGGALGELSYETVITFTASDDSRESSPPLNLGAIYLRAIYLDTFTETGLRASAVDRSRALRDEDDGALDGWTQLPLAGRETRFYLDVRQNALRLRNSEEVLVFAAQPALAISLPAVRDDPDRFLSLPRGSEVGEFSYRLRVGHDQLPAEQLEGLAARYPEARYLQLPEDSPELTWLKERARQLTSGSERDFDKLNAVLAHFQRNFEYSTQTSDVPGARGIANFMRRERGHCTSFAAAATLLLRASGISARVATGFLASDVDEETHIYTVTRRNGHAWIEVYFEGVGWQRFEPTPTQRRQEALAAEAAGEEEDLIAWAKLVLSDLAAWAKSGADEAYLDQLLETLSRGPAAAKVSAKRHPFLFSFPFALVLFYGIGRRVRKRVLSRVGDDARSVANGLLDSLLAALAEQGFHKRGSSTLREFAHGIVLDPESKSPTRGDLELRELVQILYRARFGARALDAREVERVRLWIASLRAGEFRAEDGLPT